MVRNVCVSGRRRSPGGARASCEASTAAQDGESAMMALGLDVQMLKSPDATSSEEE